MNLRQLLLFFAAGFFLILFFNIDVYKTFLDNRLVAFKDEISEDFEHMSYEDRKMARFGATYVYTQQVKKYFDSLKPKNLQILLAPNDYLEANNFQAMMPEPIVYYYYTGLRTVYPNAKDVYKSTYAFTMGGDHLLLKMLKNKEDIDNVLMSYKVKPATAQ